MFRIGAAILIVLLMAGCSATPSEPPEPKKPQGELFRINNFNPVTGEAVSDETA